jgi:hypothetical protein
MAYLNYQAVLAQLLGRSGLNAHLWPDMGNSVSDSAEESGCLTTSPATLQGGSVPLMKSTLLEKIRMELKASLERLSKAALDAHAAATDPGSKAEGKYDTRSLEASYLAVGQARQVDELAESVRVFEAFTLPDFTMEDPIAMGALVEADMRGETSLLLLVPAAGGMILDLDGQEITLLTPASKLYQNLLGKRAGDFLDKFDLLVIEVS